MISLRLSFVLTLFAGASGMAQRPAVSRPRVAGQIAAGTVSIPIGLAAGMVVGSVVGRGDAAYSLGGGLVTALIAPGLTARAIGSGPAPHGKTIEALGGGLAGFAVVGAVGWALAKTPVHLPEATWGRRAALLSLFVLPAVGATVAYDRLRP